MGRPRRFFSMSTSWYSYGVKIIWISYGVGVSRSRLSDSSRSGVKSSISGPIGRDWLILSKLTVLGLAYSVFLILSLSFSKK